MARLRDVLATLQKPKEKFSLQHLVFLCDVMEKYSGQVTGKNQAVFIETLRQLAELIVWGDQNDGRFFDVFLEKSTLSHMLRGLGQRMSVPVQIQLVQTLSILMENLKSEMALFYILSNNHINELISYRLEFADEDLMANYISFLKTVSLKLNPQTLQFFFNERQNEFPLYMEAVKFYNHPESMIRVAVRTLTLNVYKVEDQAMRRFILDKSAASYFSNLVSFISSQCEKLDRVIPEATHQRRGRLQDYTDELLDLFYYLHDVLALGIEQMNQVLTFHLLEYLFLPLFVSSIIGKIGEESGDSESTGVSVAASGGGGGGQLLSRGLALFLVAQALHIFTHAPFVNACAAALFSRHPGPYASLHSLPPSLSTHKVPPFHLRRAAKATKALASPHASRASPKRSAGAAIDAIYSSRVQPLEAAVEEKDEDEESSAAPLPGLCRATLLELLQGEEDQEILGALCLLYALLRNVGAERGLLEEAGLCPYRLSKSRRLLDSLTGTPEASAGTPGDTFGPGERQTRGNDTGREQESDSTARQNSTDGAGTVSRERVVEEEGKARNKGESSEGEQLEEEDSTNALEVSTNALEESTNAPEESKAMEIEVEERENSCVLDASEGNQAEEETQQGDKTSEERHAEQEGSRASDAPSGEGGREEGDERDERYETKGTVERDNSSAELNDNGLPLPERLDDDDDDDEEAEVKEMEEKDTKKERETRIELEREQEREKESLSDRENEGRERERDERRGVEERRRKEGGEEEVEEVVDALLGILLKAQRFRIVTLQLAILLLKELVSAEGQEPRLGARHRQRLQVAYEMAAAQLRERFVNGELGEVFLELFEDEIRAFKQLSFERLVTNEALLLPLAQGPTPGVAFALRMPAGDVEETRKAIQHFLLLRELKCAVLRQRDELLPLRETRPQAALILSEGARVDLEERAWVACEVVSRKGVGRRCLVVEGAFLLVVEPLRDGGGGILQDLLELQNMEVAVSKGDQCTMLTKTGSMTFETEEKCAETKVWIEYAKKKVRQEKLLQLYHLLGVDPLEAAGQAKPRPRLSTQEAKPSPKRQGRHADDPLAQAPL